ncbi:DUF6328 family protein [Rhodococcus sovatensis]|uniref:DUF6328 family protein n=1 Tax=Rhodococcus sovatensis TaxID=1805840 RepID=A0ABZ2PQK5_9NOCA
MFRTYDAQREVTAGAGAHCDFNREHRGESPTQTLDRNWICLLQELRVVQTGVQLLTGFLLILPFQDTFDRLPVYARATYVSTLAAAVAATVLLVAPVAMHRLLFRRKALAQLVAAAHRSTGAGLTFLGLALTGVVVLISEVVMSGYAALVGGVVALTAFVMLWAIIPFRMRPEEKNPPEALIGQN